MKTWLIIAAFLILGMAGPLPAQAPLSGSDHNPTALDAEKAALEEKYAKEAREKIASETIRVEQSLDSLYWGIAAFVSIAAIMGIFALLKTQNQAKEIARLRAEIDNQN
jgi:hypothetical protein